jgi:hypothetical protein
LADNGPLNVLEYRSLREARAQKGPKKGTKSSPVGASVAAARGERKKTGAKRQFGELDVQMIVNGAEALPGLVDDPRSSMFSSVNKS